MARKVESCGGSGTSQVVSRQDPSGKGDLAAPGTWKGTCLQSRRFPTELEQAVHLGRERSFHFAEAIG